MMDIVVRSHVYGGFLVLRTKAPLIFFLFLELAQET